MADKKQWYLRPQDLADALIEAQKLGQPTEKACNMFRLIATRLAGSASFCRYSAADKEDMISEALIKCIRNIKNFSPEKASGCFAYFTRACYCAFIGYLNAKYKHVNLIRDLQADKIESFARLNPQGAQRMREYGEGIFTDDNND